MSNPAPMKKLGEITLPRVDNAQLARLDPSTPYIVVLPPETPNKVIDELVGYFGKCNVMATVLVGEARNFRLFASLPWSVTPMQAKGDIHVLDLPDNNITQILKKHFISALHEDAEAVQDLYPRMAQDGIGSCQTELEAMVRCGLFHFQVLQDLRRVPDLKTWSQPIVGTVGRTKKVRAIAPPTSHYEAPKVLEFLTEFVPEDKRELRTIQDDMLAFSGQIAEHGVTADVENQVLVFQNKGTLMSGVLTILRNEFPGITPPTKTRRTKKSTTTVKKRATKKSK